MYYEPKLLVELEVRKNTKRFVDVPLHWLPQDGCSEICLQIVVRSSHVRMENTRHILIWTETAFDEHYIHVPIMNGWHDYWFPVEKQKCPKVFIQGANRLPPHQIEIYVVDVKT